MKNKNVSFVQDLIRYLLKRGINSEYLKILNLSESEGILKQLFENKCVNSIKYYGDTYPDESEIILEFTISYGILELLKHFEQRSEIYWIHLEMAIHNNRIDIVKYLIDDYNIEYITYRAIRAAIASGNLDMIKYIFSKSNKIYPDTFEYVVRTISDIDIIKWILNNYNIDIGSINRSIKLSDSSNIKEYLNQFIMNIT